MKTALAADPEDESASRAARRSGSSQPHSNPELPAAEELREAKNNLGTGELPSPEEADDADLKV